MRVNCLRRATGYGNSIYELQVYGSQRVAGAESVDDGVTSGDIYDLEGRLFRRNVTVEEARRYLHAGMYIHGGRVISL